MAYSLLLIFESVSLLPYGKGRTVSIGAISKSATTRILCLNLLVAATLFLLPGCMYRVKTLAEDASFTGEAVRKGGLAIFGITGANRLYPADTLQSRIIDSAMGQRLSNALPSVPLCMPESTRLLLTMPDYDFIKMHFDPSAGMDEKSREMLRGRQSYLPDFMLVGFVEVDRTWDEIDKSGDRGTGYRYMTVRANIYEVATGKLTWSGRVSQGDSKTSDRNSGLKIAGVSLTGDNWTDGPPPPEAIEVLGTIFDKLGKALAQRK